MTHSLLFHIVLIAALLFAPLPAAAELQLGSERTVCRVGYTPVPNYFTMDELGNYNGFIYDYMEVISSYTDYYFIYVPGTPSECVARLRAGEIDVVAGLLQTTVPSPGILFSQRPLTIVPAGLVLRTGLDFGPVPLDSPPRRFGYYNKTTSPEDVRIGFEPYGMLEGRDYHLISYDDMDALIWDSHKSRLDGRIAASIYLPPGDSLTLPVKALNLHLATRADSASLMAKLDTAMEHIMLSAPQFRDKLYGKFFTNGITLRLTPTERNFLRRHPVITYTAVAADEAPFFYTENGHPAGIIPEILQQMAIDLRVSFELRPSANNAEKMQMLNDGSVDIVPNFFADYNWAQRHGSKLTFPYLEHTYIAVTRRGYIPDSSSVVAALRDHRHTREFVEKQYKASQILYYDTILECLRAVSDGTADIAFPRGLTLQMMIAQGQFLNLTTNGSVVYTNPVAIAVSDQTDPILIQILNKELTHLGSARIDEIVNRRIYSHEHYSNLKTLIYQHPISALAGLGLFALAVIGFLLYRQRAQDQLFHAAYYNHLVGLPNIRLFERDVPRTIERLDMERRAGQLYLMHVHTDRLDILKTAYDPSVFFRGLRELANSVQEKNSWIRKDSISSELVRHYLLCCLPETLGPITAAEKLLRDADTMQADGFSVHMDYHIGIRAVPPEGPLDLHQLMTDAETAMNEAIERGDRIGLYNEDLQVKRLFQRQIETLLPKALDNHEFHVYLQPKYELATHRIVGAESLVRWQSPEMGFIMPGLFIDIMEKTGAVIEFDYYMLEHVCQMQRQRLDQGLPIVPIAVNQSGLHIREEGYLARMRDMTERYRLPPGTINLEITETAFIDFDSKSGQWNASSIVDALKEIGYTIAMDDFCTGYSSIVMLHHLHMDTMKIDRAMLLAAEASERGRTILRNVIAFGLSLNMNVLCEGIETQKQEDLLLEEHCRYGQGFLFARPMPADDFFVFLE